MAKAKSAKGKGKGKTGKKKKPAESRASVAVTVGWMLCTMVTLVFQLASIAAGYLARNVTVEEEGPVPLQMVPGFLLAVSALAGLLTLITTVVVYRTRLDRPPVGITIAAVVIGLIPMLVMVFSS